MLVGEKRKSPDTILSSVRGGFQWKSVVGPLFSGAFGGAPACGAAAAPSVGAAACLRPRRHMEKSRPESVDRAADQLCTLLSGLESHAHFAREVGRCGPARIRLQMDAEPDTVESVSGMPSEVCSYRTDLSIDAGDERPGNGARNGDWRPREE